MVYKRAFLDLRDVQEHFVLAFLSRGILNVSRTATLDLHATSGFLLDVLDIGTTMTHHLSAEVEARKRLETDSETLLGPFALYAVLAGDNGHRGPSLTLPYSSRSTCCCS